MDDIEVTTFKKMKSALNKKSKKRKAKRSKTKPNTYISRLGNSCFLVLFILEDITEQDDPEQRPKTSSQQSVKKTKKKSSDKPTKKGTKQNREGAKSSTEKQRRKKAQQNSNESTTSQPPQTPPASQPVSVFQFETPQSPAMRVYLPRYSNFGRRKEPKLMKIQKELGKSQDAPETKPGSNK